MGQPKSERLADVLVSFVEGFAKTATTAAEVEALAAVARVAYEVVSCR